MSDGGRKAEVSNGIIKNKNYPLHTVTLHGKLQGNPVWCYKGVLQLEGGTKHQNNKISSDHLAFLLTEVNHFYSISFNAGGHLIKLSMLFGTRLHQTSDHMNCRQTQDSSCVRFISFSLCPKSMLTGTIVQQ